ncbi:MAG: phosphatidate cytidylyltransferase [Phycisphaeraceae bacterium]|nr:phosphatidate cytidylyltransferase [Phycisphaeraceae bacterium]
MLKHRLLLGPVFIALLVGLAWLDQFLGDASEQRLAGIPIGVGLALVVTLAAVELAAMLRAVGSTTPTMWHPVFAWIGMLAWWAPGTPLPPTLGNATAASVAVAALTLGRAALTRKNSGAIVNLAGGLLTMAVLGFLPGMLLQLRLAHSAWALLVVLLLIKSCDIGAFAVGMTLGRHKLIPWVSPGKTWEGLIGGLATSAGLGALTAWLLRDFAGATSLDMTPWTGAVLGLICGFTGQIGDLAISMFKRDAGMKDSSASVPGFGGVLDLLDSPLLAGAAAFWTMALLSI